MSGAKIGCMMLTFVAVFFLLMAFTIKAFPQPEEVGKTLLGSSVAIISAAVTRKLFTGKVK